MSDTLQSYEPIAQAIQALLHPYAEVILHDLRTGRIHQVYHNLSRRSPGESSNLELNDEVFEGGALSKGPYEKINWDGRRMKSVSSVIRDAKEKPVGLLCINLDISQFDGFQKFLQDFVKESTAPSAANDLFTDDWQGKIKEFIQAYIDENRLSLQSLTRDQKQSLVQELSKKGAFRGKNAAALIGRLLNLSRATVYKYLSA